MSEYNGDSIYFIPTQEAINWKGKRVVARTVEGIEIEGVVTDLVLPGTTLNPSEWLGLNIEGQITLSPGVIQKMKVFDNQ